VTRARRGSDVARPCACLRGAWQARGEGWGSWHARGGRAGAVRANLRAPRARPARAAQELEVGAGQKSWVQSQTTFAALARDEHAGPGGLRARALKQKIWVEGVSYELQEIYGIDSLNSRRRVRPAPARRAPRAAALSQQQAGRRVRGQGSLGECVRLAASAVAADTVSHCDSQSGSRAALAVQLSAGARGRRACAAGGRADARAAPPAGPPLKLIDVRSSCNLTVPRFILRQLDPAVPEEELSEEKLCVICLVNRRDTTVLPCRHLCMCQDCAQARPAPRPLSPMLGGWVLTLSGTDDVVQCQHRIQ
jgi:hypothetical protein